jgi:hypothetical protein
MNEKQLAKLIKKNVAKVDAKGSKVRQPKSYDETLPPKPADDTDTEREAFFKEMKRREF